MSTNNSSKPNLAYPFMSRKQVAERVASDPDFAQMAIVLLQDRTTRRTDGVSGGFMSSHAKIGSALASKIDSGTELNVEELAKATELASHYCKQIASHLRDEAKRGDPKLVSVAAVFGV